MSTPKLSMKKLNELHRQLGGNAAGFYVTEFGACVHTGKHVSEDELIAINSRPSRNFVTKLVKGRIR